MLSSFSMQRLNCRFKEFTKHHWANAEAGALWEPRIRKVCAFLSELEWRSVLEGVRPCALRGVAPHELQAFSDILSSHGLILAPLEEIARENGYASARRPALPGNPFSYWCALGRASDVELLKSAHLRADDQEIGRLLGYPSCCTSFFNRACVDGDFMDTTWPMAQNTAAKRTITPTHVEVSRVSKCNVLLRWLGVRIVFHLPCSFDCRPTEELAVKYADIAKSNGFHQELDWLEEMLCWHVEWTALNGVAEIMTPAGTIWTATDATAEKYRVTYTGAESAKAMAPTMDLPDGQIQLNLISRGVEERQDKLIPLSEESYQDLEWYYADNGFSSKEDMERGHEPIVTLAAETVSQTGGNVLDLGCGNGALLKTLCHFNHKLVPWGVDISSDNIAHAQLLLPQFANNFAVSDIFDDNVVWSDDRRFQLIILMLGRLTEVNETRAETLLKIIRESANKLLVYVYDGYENQCASLDELARKTGVILSENRRNRNLAIVDL